MATRSARTRAEPEIQTDELAGSGGFSGIARPLIDRTSSLQDRTVSCADCGTPFVVTAAEQAWYAEHGRREPERCPTCRAVRRAERNAPLLSAHQAEESTAAERGVTVYGGPGHRGVSVPRQLHAAICHACGKETEIPFIPRGNRPVYCRECFSQRRPRR